MPNLFARPKPAADGAGFASLASAPNPRDSRPPRLLRGGLQLGVDPACVTTSLFFGGDHGGVFFSLGVLLISQVNR